MESRVFLDSEVHFNPKNVAVQDGKNSVALSTPINIVPPQPAKKPTRQWAAWTRQEEESFFTALRQVGKNFEKITCRVQSKNKDQVRHYYYRLVRRMNKLLGPGLYLDAKNSKDTNTAMLRWWSLLEKYSCKASKLHLKPRRFKIFVEALEHQLMKDRKKSVSKRPTPGEDCPLTPTTVSNQGRVSVNDNRAIKLVLVDSKNIQKGPGKSSLKRNVNMGINHGICKGDSTIMKSARQRRKPGVVSSASYKKWEKAAMAGVSLVADAAEHLERTTMGKEAEEDTNAGGQKSSDCAEKVLPTSFSFAQEENYAHSALKLKLQLFPIDDGTRRALEMDKHNPHLELTLSTRKKISSVAEHLNRKWGNSSVASGVILLFPYDVQRENLVGCQRWTLDSIITAADVYAMIGSPQVFRLRYGWFSSMELRPIALQEKAPIELSCISGENNMNVEKRKEHDTDLVSYAVPSTSHQCIVLSKDRSSLINKNHALDLTSTYKPNERERCCYLDPNNNVTGASYPAPNMSGQGKKDGAETAMRRLRDADDLRPSNGIPVSAVEWADSLTNISIGDLLSGASQNADCINQTALENSQCLQQIPFSCDSFDAAIATHLSRQQEKMGGQPILASHASSSIWDAEETCDAFSFQKNCIRSEESLGLSGEAFIQNARMSLVGSGCISKDLPQMERATDPTQGEPMEECQSEQLLDNPEKEFSDLADMYWPESLGLDLDMPSSKYQSQEFILSDSLSGLNRLIASSVDAFQNCSFFGLDKKEPASSMEARETETASFSDFKIGSGV